MADAYIPILRAGPKVELQRLTAGVLTKLTDSPNLSAGGTARDVCAAVTDGTDLWFCVVPDGGASNTVGLWLMEYNIAGDSWTERTRWTSPFSSTSHHWYVVGAYLGADGPCFIVQNDAGDAGQRAVIGWDGAAWQTLVAPWVVKVYNGGAGQMATEAPVAGVQGGWHFQSATRGTRCYAAVPNSVGQLTGRWDADLVVQTADAALAYTRGGQVSNGALTIPMCHPDWVSDWHHDKAGLTDLGALLYGVTKAGVFEVWDPRPCPPNGLRLWTADGVSWLGDSMTLGWVFRSPKAGLEAPGGYPYTTDPAGAWETQSAYQVRVVDALTGTEVYNSGKVASAVDYLLLDTSAWPVGEYIARVTVWDTEDLASDEAGLNITKLAGTPVVYASTVAFLWPVAEDTLANLVTVRVQVTPGTAAISGVTIRLDGAAPVAMTDAGSGVWTYAWDTTAGADGGHNLLVTATDAAGLTGTATVHVLADNSGLSAGIAIIAPVAGEIVRGPYTVSAQTVETGTVSFALDGTSLGTAAISGDRASLVYDFTATAPGSYTLTATAPSGAQDTVRFTVAEVTTEPTPGTSTDANQVNVIAFADLICPYCGGPVWRDPDSAALTRKRGFCADCADFYGLAEATDARSFFQSPTIPEVATEALA